MRVANGIGNFLFKTGHSEFRLAFFVIFLIRLLNSSVVEHYEPAQLIGQVGFDYCFCRVLALLMNCIYNYIGTPIQPDCWAFGVVVGIVDMNRRVLSSPVYQPYSFLIRN